MLRGHLQTRTTKATLMYITETVETTKEGCWQIALTTSHCTRGPSRSKMAEASSGSVGNKLRFMKCTRVQSAYRNTDTCTQVNITGTHDAKTWDTILSPACLGDMSGCKAKPTVSRPDCHTAHMVTSNHRNGRIIGLDPQNIHCISVHSC